ncbi:MAG TPA: hypothetical protein DDW52_08065 [Planctomycetaceae bacterium]|nr:hypothetical protein [Planctomycetaceae bacterium]
MALSIALGLVAALSNVNSVTAGCHQDTSPVVLQSGLHLIAAGAPASQVPIVSECWWYAGPVQVLYDHGELKYFPLLRSMRCHGPGCERRPSDSDFQPAAIVPLRSAYGFAISVPWSLDFPRSAERERTGDPLLPPAPFLAGLFRPPK